MTINPEAARDVHLTETLVERYRLFGALTLSIQISKTS